MKGSPRWKERYMGIKTKKNPRWEEGRKETGDKKGPEEGMELQTHGLTSPPDPPMAVAAIAAVKNLFI